MDRKTKIIATIGPASSSIEIIKKMILEGVNVCRINFSHGTHKENIQAIKNVREIDAALGCHTSILADLQGPKIRIGTMPKDGATLMNGAEFSRKAMHEAGVAIVPGSAFGETCQNYVRFSFAASRDNISQALENIKKMLG